MKGSFWDSLFLYATRKSRLQPIYHKQTLNQEQGRAQEGCNEHFPFIFWGFISAGLPSIKFWGSTELSFAYDFGQVMFATAMLHGVTAEICKINVMKATWLNFLTVVATMFRNAWNEWELFIVLLSMPGCQGGRKKKNFLKIKIIFQYVR